MKAYISITLALSALCAMGQDLKTEITLDRTVLPEQKAAERPGIAPATLPVPEQKVELLPAEYGQMGTITRGLAALPAAEWTDGARRYPGYVYAGFLPTLNATAGAGYRFVDTSTTNAEAWLRYSGTKYKRGDGADESDINNQFLSGGASVSHWTNARSRIWADAGYYYARIKSPADRDKHVDQYRIKAGWESQAGRLAYDLGAGFGRFSFNRSGLSQNHWKLNADLGVVSDADDRGIAYRWLGLNATADFLHIGYKHEWGGLRAGSWPGPLNWVVDMGQIHLSPYLRLGPGAFKAQLGAGIDFFTGQDPWRRISPEVKISWEPADMPIAAEVSAMGASKLCPLSEFFAICPYINRFAFYSSTDIPYDIEAQVNIGRISGFALQFFGGYAHANSFFLPTNGELSAPYHSFMTEMQAFRANSWHAGAKASYAYKDLMEVWAGAETGGSNHKPISWWQWMDNAKLLVNAGVKARPISKLEVSLALDVRTKRSQFLVNYATPHGPYDGNISESDLGNMVNLSLDARYHLSPALTLWACAANLTNSTYREIGYNYAQGIHGMVGFCYKF